MNQKKLGAIILFVGLFLALLTFLFNQREEYYIDSFIGEMNSCYLADGTCLHADRDYTIYIMGYSISLALILLSLYLMFFDKTEQVLAEQQLKVSEALGDYSKRTSEKDKFEAFLSGFNDEEKKVIQAIHDQEGIKQSTLRYRTGMSKTSLSLLLKSLEQRGFVSRKKSGKTNDIFLIKKF